MDRPFESVTVLDLTHVLAGPFCTYQLALLGARTIKIEDPSDPDCERFRGPSAELNEKSMGVNYLAQGANKESLTLNLRTEEGRAILKRLVTQADVLVENYRAGAFPAMGLGYDDLSKLNDQLIYCSMTGFGQAGSKEDTTAYDNVIQAASGLMSLNGTSDTTPLKVGPAVIDFASGITAAFAVASALFQRTHTGKGQYIDFAMLNAAMSLITTNAVVNIFKGGELTTPKGNKSAEAGIACYDTKDGLLMLAAFNPKQHRRLWQALGRTDFAEQSSWTEIIGGAESFRPVLIEKLQEKTAAEWEVFFKNVRVPAERVRNLTEAIELQKSTTPGFFQTLDCAEGPLEVPLTAFALKHGGAAVTSPPPALGEHNDEILAELGFDAAGIDGPANERRRSLMLRELEASVFATLPDELHYRGEPTEWSRTVRPGKRIHSFLEGPSFDRDGNLYVSDTPHGRIFRVDPAGKWELAVAYDGQPNGLAIHRDGRLFIADYAHGIMVFDRSSGGVDTVTREKFLGCSDLVFHSSGDLYFTDAGHTSLQDPSGSVYRLSAGGDLKRLFSGVPYPNGIAFDPLESDGFIAATRGNAVWQFTSSTLMVGTFVQLTGGLGPDGLAVDVDGRIAVAHARNGIVWLIDPNGEKICKITTRGKSVTSVAYGGVDNKWLYITEADEGTISRVELETPGLPLFSHQ